MTAKINRLKTLILSAAVITLLPSVAVAQPVGFFYLDNPEGDGPAIPVFKDRVPALMPLPLEQPK